MRSDAKLLMICDASCLVFPKRDGAISSASILLETSMAKTISTPWRLTVSIRVPNFGFTKAIINEKTVAANNIILIKGLLVVEASGAKRFRRLPEPNSAIFFFFQAVFHRYTAIKIVINRNK